MNYEFLLENGDKIKKLDSSVKVDLDDYVSMREKVLPCIVKWEFIRSFIVTEHGHTLWQLSEKYLNSNERPIGVFEPPVSLIKWILKNKNNE